MKNLFYYIENLLVRNDYVIVPNFGGFVVQRQSAEIEDNRIIPPTATIGYNPLLQHSDGLLAIEISQNEGVIYREAVQFIENEVCNIKNKLKNDNEIAVGKLGKLYPKNEKILFVPENNLDFLPANFQLNEIQVQALKVHKLPAANNITFRNAARYAASIALAFGLLFAAPLFDTKHQEAGFTQLFRHIEPAATTFESIEYQGNTVVDVLPDVKEEESVVEKETIDAPTTTPTPATVPTKIATKNYHIIVGCFAKQNTAEKYANSLKNSNFPNASIIPSRKNTKVSIGAYPSENEAYTAMRELQQNTKLSAWVLETEQ